MLDLNNDISFKLCIMIYATSLEKSSMLINIVINNTGNLPEKYAYIVESLK